MQTRFLWWTFLLTFIPKSIAKRYRLPAFDLLRIPLASKNARPIYQWGATWQKTFYNCYRCSIRLAITPNHPPGWLPLIRTRRNMTSQPTILPQNRIRDQYTWLLRPHNALWKALPSNKTRKSLAVDCPVSRKHWNKPNSCVSRSTCLISRLSNARCENYRSTANSPETVHEKNRGCMACKYWVRGIFGVWTPRS